MGLSLCILASGSAGNCSILRSPHGVVMIDAGLSPRATAKRLEGTGVSVEQIDAICLTHLDGDHYHRGWNRIIAQNQIKVFCAHRQRRDIVTHPDHDLAGLLHGMDPRPFEPVRGLCVTAIDLRHDDDGSNGFLFESHQIRIGFATDFGRVPQVLIEAFVGVDVLAIESNYDPVLQLQSERPAFLKNRIMGGRGHLSNIEAFSAVVRILNESQKRFAKLPSHVALLHRSQECNCPELLRRLFCRDVRLIERLILAEQDHRSQWISPTPRRASIGEQLALDWSAAAAY